MKGLLRRPIVHFLALGALLFALDARRDPVADAPPARVGAAPLSDEELLYRDARARGLHRSDALVRRRLVRNMRFLAESESAGDDALFARALALGMDERDLVVRRRLVQRVALDVAAAARREEPSEEELRAHLERRVERFAQPARVRLSHVFLSRSRRGAALSSDAGALRAELAGRGPGAGAGRGDPPPLPATLFRSRDELAARLGDAFARAVFALEPGGWWGPVPSSYGLHLVWIHERLPARPAELARVRAAVRESLLADRAGAALEERLRWLRARR